MSIKKCIACGSEFEGFANSRYCSERCRNAKIPTLEHVGEIHYELKISGAYRQKSMLYVDCVCSCGKECITRYDPLRSGHVKTCGHNRDIYFREKRDLTGQINQYGVEFLYEVGKKGRTTEWHCKCGVCGKEFNTTLPMFDRIKSCGCVRDNIFRDMKENAKQDGTDVYKISSKKLNKNNKSGIKGVCWNNKTKKWRAYISFKGKNYQLGNYDNIEDAACARKKAEEEKFGNFLEWFSEVFPERWEQINKNTES